LQDCVYLFEVYIDKTTNDRNVLKASCFYNLFLDVRTGSTAARRVGCHIGHEELDSFIEHLLEQRGHLQCQFAYYDV